MKLIISLLLFPSFVSILLAYGCYGFYKFGMADILSSEFTSRAHIWKAFMYMAMGSGLPLAVFSFLTAVPLAFCAFVFKSWTRAVFAIAIAASGMYIWLYFLNVDFPA